MKSVKNSLNPLLSCQPPKSSLKKGNKFFKNSKNKPLIKFDSLMILFRVSYEAKDHIKNNNSNNSKNNNPILQKKCWNKVLRQRKKSLKSSCNSI